MKTELFDRDRGATALGRVIEPPTESTVLTGLLFSFPAIAGRPPPWFARNMAEAQLLNPTGYTPLPAGKIATVVTHLEMRARPVPRPEPAPNPYALRRPLQPDLAWYRDLFRRVGTDWLWFSRLALNDVTLTQLLHDPAIEVHALRHRGRDEGILEFDFRRFPDVEITFFGVVPTLLGKGAGRYLMNRALEIAWGRNPRRVSVHTCTLDHPRALEFYVRSGFTPYARSIEVSDDPRILGLLPRTAAPQVPILG